MRAELIRATADAVSYFHGKMATALLDLRFGCLLHGVKFTRYAESGAYATANSSYDTVWKLFRGRVQPADVLVDVGCGKGRVINAWLHEGYANRIIGVELDPKVAAEARTRLKRFRNVNIVTGDILANFPEDGTLFYLFNPFDASVMEKFRNRLKTSLLNRGCREATVIYNNCRHLEVFVTDSTWQIEQGRLEYEFAIIHSCGPGRPGKAT